MALTNSINESTPNASRATEPAAIPLANAPIASAGHDHDRGVLEFECPAQQRVDRSARHTVQPSQRDITNHLDSKGGKLIT